MKAHTRDLLIGIASIVFSVCAGSWTLFNYNVSQDKIQLEAIFTITEKFEWIKLKELEIKKIKRDKKEREVINRKKEVINNEDEVIAKLEEEIAKKEVEIKRLIYELLSEVRYRFTQIKKPYLMDETDWNESWINLYNRTEDALSGSFDMYKKLIDEAWNEILKSKNIQSIDKMAKERQ